MKNIIYVDAKNSSTCDLVSSINDGTNRVLIEIKSDVSLNPVLHVGSTTVTITSDDYVYQIPNSSFTAGSNITFYISDDLHTVGTFIIAAASNLNGNWFVNQESDLRFALSTEYRELPYYTKSETDDLLSERVSKYGDAINGNFQINGGLGIGSNISLWSDGEGGNFHLKGGDSTDWEIDAFDGNLRIFNFSNNTYPGITIDKGGTLHTLGMQMHNSGGMWIIGKTQTKCIVAKQFDSDDAYFTFFRANTYSNHVFNIGGIGDKIGFYGFHRDRTTNGYDWATCWNVDDGLLYHSKSVIVEGIAYFNSGANFQNNNIAGVRELVFVQGTSGHITNYDNQQMYIAASPEANFQMFYGVRESGWRLCPHVNSNITLGSPSYRWSQIYSTSASISTSDRNLKKNIEPLTDKYFEFFLKLAPVSFQFVYGTSGRTHIGFVSQDVEQAMKECGITDLDFAGFCKDRKYETVTRTVKTVNDETGETETKEVEDFVPVEGEYIYSLRYEEFIALNTAATQRLNAKVDKLNKKIDRLIEILGVDVGDG